MSTTKWIIGPYSPGSIFHKWRFGYFDQWLAIQKIWRHMESTFRGIFDLEPRVNFLCCNLIASTTNQTDRDNHLKSAISLMQWDIPNLTFLLVRIKNKSGVYKLVEPDHERHYQSSIIRRRLRRLWQVILYGKQLRGGPGEFFFFEIDGKVNS